MTDAAAAVDLRCRSHRPPRRCCGRPATSPSTRRSCSAAAYATVCATQIGRCYQSLNAAPARRPGHRGPPPTLRRRKTRSSELLLANDFAGLEQLFTAFFASIPTDWYRNNPIAEYEGYYASVFYAYFASLGLDLTPEESSNAGRLDLALRFNGQVYLFEFKVVELAPEGRALEQIKARGYAERYRASGEPIHLVGVEFSRERRSVVGFEVETLT